MIEVVKLFLIKEIEGFGELFRYLSYVEDVGMCVLLFCVVVGIVNNKLIFLILGLIGVVKLVLEKFIKLELNYLIYEFIK